MKWSVIAIVSLTLLSSIGYGVHRSYAVQPETTIGGEHRVSVPAYFRQNQPRHWRYMMLARR